MNRVSDDHMCLALSTAFAWHCFRRGRTLLCPAFHQQDFNGKSNSYFRQHCSEVVKMGKPETSVWAFRSIGVFLSSLQLLPAINAGVCAFDMLIHPTGIYHPSSLLLSIGLSYPDCGRPETAWE